jgi:hypothetical protein
MPLKRGWYSRAGWKTLHKSKAVGGFFLYTPLECRLLAHRVISWRRSNSVAFGAERT